MKAVFLTSAVLQLMSRTTPSLAAVRRRCRRAGLLVCGLILAAAIGAGHRGDVVDPRDIVESQSAWSLAIDPHKTLGSSRCEKCHANEVAIWKKTPHHTTFFTLHRTAQAGEIADRLGIADYKSDSNCIQCHYTMQQSGSKLVALSGVSCESCHGASADWIDIHNDYGGPGATAAAESDAHRQDRLALSIAAGMRNPINAYLVARSCYRCHSVPDERLVNVGGHVAGTMDFELVSWSQGSLRHHFLAGNAIGNNPPASPQRLRILFVAGMIADLEFSLRATALATEKGEFATASARRADRAAKRLESIAAKIDHAAIDRIMETYGQLRLRLGNGEQLVAAADIVQTAGLEFAATADPEALAVLDAFIPLPDRWK